MSKKIFYYSIIFLIYIAVGVFLGIKLMPGFKPGVIIGIITMLAIYSLTIWFFEKDNYFIKKSNKLKAMFNYFDIDQVKSLINTKKEKGDRFELFNSDDQNQKVTVLTIKVLNNDAIKTLEPEKRVRTFGKLLEVIETNIEKRYGLIYNIKDDLITCLFNTVYMIENPDLEAIKTALNINIDLMKFREEDFVLSQVRLDYSIVNEDMDFYIRDKRVLVNGNFDLSNELVNISGEDSIYIPENIFKKYMNKLDYDYLGKFYFPFGDEKVYKIIKIVNDEEIIENTYKTSKVHLKKGSEKNFKKYIKEVEQEKMRNKEQALIDKINNNEL